MKNRIFRFHLLAVAFIVLFVLLGSIVGTAGASTSGVTLLQAATKSKKVALVTSEWLCNSRREALLTLVQRIRASDIQIYFGASQWLDENWGWKMRQIDGHVNYFRSKGFAVWLSIRIYTLDESKGIAHNIQSYVDRYKGSIVGIHFDFHENVTEVAGYTIQDIQNWLVAKKEQLARNGIMTMYYHGDGAAPYGSPGDVDPVYLTNEGIILRAWLQDWGSWKPLTFDLRKFWINYVIIRGKYGQTYDDIMNWYKNIVISRYNLKKNAGAETLLWEVMNERDMPGAKQINAMKDVAKDWLASS